jgi:hypothetical protein
MTKKINKSISTLFLIAIFIFVLMPEETTSDDVILFSSP